MRKLFTNSFFKKALITVLSLTLVFVFFASNINSANAGFFGDFTFAVRQFKKEFDNDLNSFDSTVPILFAKIVNFNRTVSEAGDNLAASVVSPFIKTADTFSRWNEKIESKFGDAYLKIISYIVPGYTVEIFNQPSISAYHLPETQETVIKEIVRETIIKTPPTEKIVKQEVQKITETEKVTEVTKVTETIKEADLTNVNNRITGVESMLASIRTPDNYVSSPRMFNESGNLTFTARGGGSILLAADNGLQLNAGQIILDANGAVNTTPYITVKDILNLDNTNIKQTGSSLTNTFEGNLTINNNTTLGDASTDTLTINSSIDSNFIPATTNTYTLGSSTNQWKSLYVSGSTIYLDGIAISNSNGTLTWAGSGGIQSTASTTAPSSLNVTGNITLGDASTDTIILNSASLTSASSTTWNIADTGSLTWKDGTNTLLTLTDSGTYGTLAMNTLNLTTALAVAYGGTAATNSTDARSNLGLAIGTNVQAYDAELAAIAGLASAADLMTYYTGSATAATSSLTSFGRSLIDDANSSTARTTLGLAIGTDVQSYSSLLADIAALSTADSNFIVANGSTWVAETGATARTSLGVGTGNSPTFTALTLSGLTNGSILFATSSGIISQDNSNLFWDDVNNRLGIGTTTPGRKLDVIDNSNAQMRLTNNGSIYTDFQVAASTGDLTISLAPSSSANDIILNMPSGSTGANLWVCEGDACPSVSLSTGGNIVVEGDIKYPSAAGAKRSIILTAVGAVTPTTSGAAKTQVDGTYHSYYVLDYDAAADEAAYWQWTMPDSYNDASIDVTYYWEAGATANDVIFCFQAKGLTANNAEDIDSEFSTAVCETDTAQGNANDLASATESAAASNFTKGEYVTFKVFRDANAGGDTMTGDARLVKVKIEYGVSQESD